MISIFLIAVSLAMDAMAVSISSGISVKGFGPRDALRMGFYFGAFQFVMPLVGWLFGTSVFMYIKTIGPLIAFGVLSVIGGRMVYESCNLAGGRKKHTETHDVITMRRLVALAVATSIDALMTGVSMALINTPVLPAAVLIGVMAFLLSLAGGLMGRRLGVLFQQRAELAGGIVLIAIGIHILLEHQCV